MADDRGEAYLDKARRWFVDALRWGVIGGMVGLAMGVLFARFGDIGFRGTQTEAMLVVGLSFAACGFGLVGAVPMAIAAWFLLLHMISEISRATRGD